MYFEELWLLEVVIGAHPPWDGWIPFWALPDDDPEEKGCCNGFVSNHADINFYSHHMPQERLVEELCRLFDNGEIIATHLGYERSQPDPMFVPSREEIVAGLNRGTKHPWLCYTLTEKGMQRWEDYAEPNWSIHLQQAGIRGCGQFVSAIAASADVARRWIEYSVGNGGGLIGQVHWDRAMYQFIRPWKAYPSKTLPSGVYVIIPTSRDEAAENEATDWDAWEKRREQLLEGITPWYRRSVATWEADRLSP